MAMHFKDLGTYQRHFFLTTGNLIAFLCCYLHHVHRNLAMFLELNTGKCFCFLLISPSQIFVKLTNLRISWRMILFCISMNTQQFIFHLVVLILRIYFSLNFIVIIIFNFLQMQLLFASMWRFYCSDTYSRKIERSSYLENT